MNPDQILTDVLADRAELRPDPGEVLAQVQQRLASGHRVPVARIAAVAGTAAVVAATAVSAVALSHRNGHADPHRAVAVAGTTHGRTGGTASTPTTPAATQASAGTDYSTIAAGWLPGPARQVGASNQPGFEQRDYDVNVDGVDMDVIIYMESGTELPARTEAGADYRDVTINGYPGREFIAGNATIVAFNLGNGEIAYAGPSVVAPSGTVTTARITDIAVQVASGIQFGRHDPIPANQNVQDLTPAPR